MTRFDHLQNQGYDQITRNMQPAELPELPRREPTSFRKVFSTIGLWGGALIGAFTLANGTRSSAKVGAFIGAAVGAMSGFLLGAILDGVTSLAQHDPS